MKPLRAITAASIFGRRLSLVTLAAGLALGASVPCAGGARAASRDPFTGAEPRGVEIAMEGKTLRVTMPRSAWQDPARDVLADRDFMALLPVDFGDGIIEVEVKSSLAPGAPAFARGFVGIAFHVADGRFEKFYLRPANGTADDMIRRNHTVQYASFPDFRFDRLRREAPERYETAADIAPDRWVHMRIEVTGNRARLFLDRRTNPVLIVNDLKLGANRRGRIGLWVETGTIAHFRKLRITPADEERPRS
jgi:hypothetical protein